MMTPFKPAERNQVATATTYHVHARGFATALSTRSSTKPLWHAPAVVSDLSDLDDAYGRTTARFYDAAYQDNPQTGRDADFYRALAREGAGPVLELGCGTGRVLLRIAADGFPCTGLDASRHMLDALRAKSTFPNLRLVHAPMQRFDLGSDRFGLVYAAFRVFQHLYTVEDQLACLDCVRRHLAPGGRFAFDVFRPRLERMAQLEEPEHLELRFEHGGESIARFTTVTRDPAAQLLSLRFRYERSRGGEVVGNEEARFRMRWFWRFELEHLLARAGFREVQIHGDFERGPVGPDSPAFVVVAR
jgi:SAM-dependent methyltransferase